MKKISDEVIHRLEQRLIEMDQLIQAEMEKPIEQRQKEWAIIIEQCRPYCQGMPDDIEIA